MEASRVSTTTNTMSHLPVSYQSLYARLIERVESHRVITDPMLTMAFGTDASFYRLNPYIVVRVDSLSELCFVMASCVEKSLSFTFRAAGTSLSGQAISDSVLIMLTDSWRGHEILEDGAMITLQPGVIGADANRLLMPYQRKIGPDPASINTCKIGGIAANNASGMCCGTTHNSYQTLAGMTLVLWDGTVLDTRDSQSIKQFYQTHSLFIENLIDLAKRCKNDSVLNDKIRHKYRLKNTTGYSLNALIDYQDPVDILQHLMIGSEGTLGFIADITYRTVPDHPNKTTGLYVFEDIETTCRVVSELAKTDIAAVELMDSRSLASVVDEPGMPAFLARLTGEPAAILVEIHASSAEQLHADRDRINAIIETFSPIESVDFSEDREVASSLWAVRKGLFPAVGAVRETGTTVIIEDVAFPIEHLAPAVRELQLCFERFGYDEAIIFGHALAGNLHFVFTQGFESEDEVKRYGDFMDAVSKLVAVDYQGSLKAEHGTGRNMAPYIELEWGAEGVALMEEIKAIFDPNRLLNPGVIINDDKQAHLKHLKAMPAADDIIDKCIECGFCEPVCPSRNLSLTPRQRNTIYRELKRMEREGESKEQLEAWEKQYQYFGVDTCAATGLCADRCPVNINTGDLVRKLRGIHSPLESKIATWTAEQFSHVSQLSGQAFGIVDLTHKVIGRRALTNVGTVLHKAGLPMWTPAMPMHAGKLVIDHQQSEEALKINRITKQKVVYFPSCAAREMGPMRGGADTRSIPEVTMSLLARAGFEVILPDSVASLCCGMPFKSKGFSEQSTDKAAELEEALWKVSDQGVIPILMDTSPCASLSKERFTQELSVYEPFEFIAEHVLPLLEIIPQTQPVMLHITCTSRRRGLASLMEKVAKACANTVIVPEGIECCGFAGDKGFNVPELNASALSTLAKQVPPDCCEGYSNSRTCEIGLSHHSGIEYRSILYLVDKVSQK